jgi:hypothetical protein
MFPVPRGFLSAVRITGRSGLPSLPIGRMTNILVAVSVCGKVAECSSHSLAQSRSGHDLMAGVGCGTDSAVGRPAGDCSMTVPCVRSGHVASSLVTGYCVVLSSVCTEYRESLDHLYSHVYRTAYNSLLTI